MIFFEDYLTHYAQLVAGGEPFVSVTLVKVRGSAPQDAGSKMLVSAIGLVYGTVGGGRVEQKAIATAQKMLAAGDGSRSTALYEWNLQTDVGMTCGGVVTFYFETVHHRVWNIAIFGAGHVSQALTRLLCELDCRVVCVDPRPEWLDRLPDSPKLTAVHEENMPLYVPSVPDNAFVLCVTMGHRTDRPILEELYRQGRLFPYLGVIGCLAKRAVLERELSDAGVPADWMASVRCPIGLDLGTNDPPEIAVSIAAELIQERDRR
jgi:xanthine dehydrogenase accessory factor